jgi:SAM-dependent methyltransferase
MVDQASEGLLSPYLRRRRIAAVMPYLRGRVLDVGCGTGSLARLVEPKLYMGVDRDAWSIAKAQASFPKHDFNGHMPAADEKFDTVIALAVIEHVSNPAEFLQNLASHLVASTDARIVCTTPHPSVDWLHDTGAAIGLFSKHASDEHEDLLDFSHLKTAGLEAGLNLLKYRRFLVGANQLAVFQPDTEHQ